MHKSPRYISLARVYLGSQIRKNPAAESPIDIHRRTFFPTGALLKKR